MIVNRIVLSALVAAISFSSCSSSEPSDSQSSASCKKIRRVLFIGDSITDGAWGHDCSGSPSAERNHTDMNHIYGHGYMMLCASDIQSRFPMRDVKFFNRGISGHTLSMMLGRWAADCVDLRPDLVSILIGTNDVEYYVGADSVVAPFDFCGWDAQFRHALDTLQSVCPDVRLVLCTPFVARSGWRGEAPNFSQRQSLIDSLDCRVAALANDYGAVLVRFDELFRDLAQNQPRADYWVWDGVHPTAAAHRRMADLWLESTAGLFAE